MRVQGLNVYIFNVEHIFMFLEIYNAKYNHKKSDRLVMVILSYQHLEFRDMFISLLIHFIATEFLL